MKVLYYFIFLLLFPFMCFGQAGEWTWMKGDNGANSQGNPGIMGVPSPDNDPAATYATAFWTDTSGAFWVYTSQIGNYGMLWKFDPVSTN